METEEKVVEILQVSALGASAILVVLGVCAILWYLFWVYFLSKNEIFREIVNQSYGKSETVSRGGEKKDT
eukprot:CAMPEP_0119125078 /NCGR_PEP_ID=MMETSP1310-20130426/4476_1 /TAXON_ID=464262 /ORGANISM="Genus nov. species nov., Strain RCC2339" /LENGTH=69 /DNA_ID=CAMNT_0007115105 /DNA_START=148 /DNA_END=357 /DNA_ORIENTATION=+